MIRNNISTIGMISVILLWATIVVVVLPIALLSPSTRVMALAPSVSASSQTLYARHNPHSHQQQQLLTTSTTRIPSLSSASSASSPNYYNHHRRNRYQHSSSSTTTTQLASGKILPIAYTGASGMLLYKAILLTSTTVNTSSRLVLIAMSLLSLFNFSTSDNIRLKSSKIAYQEKTHPSSSGKEKQYRQAAITYRFAIRVKIIGQFLGLIRMIFSKSTVGIMRGGAIIISSQLLYFFVGGGSSNHDNEGNWKPLSDKAVMSVLCIDAILVTAALIAASSSPTTQLFTITSGLFAFGSFIGSIEGIPQFIKTIENKTN
jgi:hypothetical protein